MGLVDKLEIDQRNQTENQRENQRENQHYDHNDDHNEYVLSSCLDFLSPYIQQPFPGSVIAIKKSIASVEDMPACDSKDLESKMFASRWWSEDSAKIFASKNVKQPS